MRKVAEKQERKDVNKKEIEKVVASKAKTGTKRVKTNNRKASQEGMESDTDDLEEKLKELSLSDEESTDSWKI